MKFNLAHVITMVAATLIAVLGSAVGIHQSQQAQAQVAAVQKTVADGQKQAQKQIGQVAQALQQTQKVVQATAKPDLFVVPSRPGYVWPKGMDLLHVLTLGGALGDIPGTLRAAGLTKITDAKNKAFVIPAPKTPASSAAHSAPTAPSATIPAKTPPPKNTSSK